MEQALSFIALFTLLIIFMITESPILFLITFFGGGTYLGFRGKKMGWSWPKRP
jgi:threonine/homoserine/homoserine lactone efflux protein